MQIKKLLQQRQQMTLSDLARHFYLPESVMLSMLERWIRKGRVEKTELSGVCGSACGSCDDAGQPGVLYRWKSVAEKPIYTRTSD